MNKRKNLTLAITAALILTVLTAIALSAVKQAAIEKSIELANLPTYEPSVTGDRFFTALSGGQYDVCEECAGVSLGLNDDYDDPTAAALNGMLRESYSYSIVNADYDGKMGAVLTVDFTFLDISKTQEPLSELVTELAYESAYAGTDISDVETAMAFFTQAFDTIMADPTPFYATERFTIEMLYKDGAWTMELPDDLASAICGHADHII